MKRSRSSGVTLIEIMIAVAIFSVIVGVFFTLIKPNLRFFQRVQGRQQAALEARKCLDTIRKFIGNARSSSISLSSGANAPPNSRIEFLSVDGSSSTIAWESVPPNTVHLRRSENADANFVDSIIGTHVTGLMFTLDSRDPTILNVSLQIDYPLGSVSGDPNNYYTLVQPNQTIRIGTAQ